MLEQEYLRPETLSEAVMLKDKYGKDARILAGGTDLIINLRDNMISCKYIIDIKKVPEMREISYDQNSGLSVGGAVTLNEMMKNEEVKSKYPILVESSKTLANSLLRNRATMLGNICNASPAGDMIPSALVLEGSVEVLSNKGARNIPLKHFFLGVKKNAIFDNEIAVRIIFPRFDGTGAYLKKSRIKGHDLAQIGVAGMLKNDGKLMLAIAAAAPTPLFFDNLGNFDKRNLGDENIIKNIIEKVMKNIHPISDQRASKEYRIAMAEYLIGEVLQKISKEV
ncbi:MAG: coxM [Clostridiales bacterium]|nr:coxM [Clostridiales bacterium]